MGLPGLCRKKSPARVLVPAKMETPDTFPLLFLTNDWAFWLLWLRGEKNPDLESRKSLQARRAYRAPQRPALPAQAPTGSRR
jgi:hypothetical protein